MINICLSADNNYAPYAGVVIASVLKNSKPEDELCFYILDGGIEDINKQKLKSLVSIKSCGIHFVPVDQEKFDDYKKITTHSYVSLATYYRLKLSQLLNTDVERAIYLDCDIVVNDSLAELFNTDLEGNYIGGIMDIRVKYKPKWKNRTYINAGVLLIDLKKMRQDKIEKKFLEYTKENIENITAGDQDIINYTLDGKIKILDDLWNVQVSSFLSRSNFTKYPKIIHYIAKKKPWKFGSYSYFKEKYFEYLSYTPWAISEEEKFRWTVWNEICSILNFVIDKPLFLFRPKYWEAVFASILKR